MDFSTSILPHSSHRVNPAATTHEVADDLPSGASASDSQCLPLLHVRWAQGPERQIRGQLCSLRARKFGSAIRRGRAQRGTPGHPGCASQARSARCGGANGRCERSRSWRLAMNTTYKTSNQPQRSPEARIAQIDMFYDWIYRRGIARLAARGITPQMLYHSLHQEERQ